MPSVLKSSDACGNPFGVRRKPALRLFAASSVVACGKPLTLLLCETLRERCYRFANASTILRYLCVSPEILFLQVSLQDKTQFNPRDFQVKKIPLLLLTVNCEPLTVNALTGIIYFLEFPNSRIVKFGKSDR